MSAIVSSQGGRVRRGAAVLAATLAAVVLGVGPAAPSVGAQSEDRRVEIELVPGHGGVVGERTVFPLKVTMTSPRARHADVRVDVDGNSGRTFRVELVAGAPVELDLAMTPPPWGATAFRVGVEVSEVAGRRLGGQTVEVVPDPELTVVGVGPALAGSSEPRQGATLANIQRALYVPLGVDQWARPGVLASMSSVVLGPEDLDALTDVQRTTLRTWVWAGGHLILDVARSDELPVIDRPASQGARTAVGAGWVRFTDGAAERGPIDAVVEPAVARVSTDEFGGWPALGDQLGEVGLIEVSFLPATVVIVAVFGTALLAGPVLWFAFRNRDRRRLMWVASPLVSLVVAGGLLAVGQGIFTRAEVRASGGVVVDGWSSSGDLAFGLEGSRELRLSGGTELLGSSPSAVVRDLGEGRTVSLDVPRNSFGYVGLSDAVLEEGPDIEVTAVTTGDGRADVTVTNRSAKSLRDVTVFTAGRTRPFEDVPAGESVTLPFVVDAELDVMGLMYPFDDWNGGARWTSTSSPTWPLSRGLVILAGRTDATVATSGLRASGDIAVQAMVPVTSGEAPTLRIDTVGASPLQSAMQVEDDWSNSATTIVVGEPETGDTSMTAVVRLSSDSGRAASPCGIHTSVQRVELWDGQRWSAAQKVGEPAPSANLVGANEVQAWELPEIPAGAARFLRLHSGLSLAPPLLFDCGVVS